jgi:uracil-DNA glycosylase
MEVKLDDSWKKQLAPEFEKPYFKELSSFVHDEYKAGLVYPPPKNIFRALDLCPFEKVEVVILGQDPYHGPGQANGLSFAVEDGVPIPPSLQNIFKEIVKEYEKPLVHTSGDLSRWATQGVLLLNATLTVKARSAGSHQDRGWEEFTSSIVKKLSDERTNVVFILWGNYARARGVHIDREKHLVLESAHPSPFSAYNGFFGNNHFKLANEYLVAHDKKPIDWL